MKSALVRCLLLVFVLALAACAGVLGIKKSGSGGGGAFGGSHPFEHKAHVSKGVQCVECHTGVASAEQVTDSDGLHFPTASECVKCHAKPHDTRDCLGCHGESHVRGAAKLAREHLKFEHHKHMGRVNGDCVRCHQDVQLAEPVSLRPQMAVCFSCHEHKDQWTTRDCDSCHIDLKNEHTPPTSHLIHEGDWLREHGVRAASSRDLCQSCHTERQCASCHGVGTTPALPARLAFDDTRLSGLHRAGFRSRHADEARAQPGLCATCHNSEQSCHECHAAKHVGAGSFGSRSPHPPGWISAGRGGEHGLQARIDPMACASCHGGPAGEQLCIGCHKVGGPGGNPHGRNFSSTKNKAHDVPCRSCHAAGP